MTALARPVADLLGALEAKGLRRGIASSRPTRRPIPTGQAALDAALGSGGLPAGSLALFDAPPGSGATSLALGALAAAQAAGGLVAYLDLPGTLDPASAARVGVRLDWLLVVRPGSALEAVELAGWLARSRLIDAFVLDLEDGEADAARPLERLPTLLVRTASTGLLLAQGPLRQAAARQAGIRLRLERRAWLAIGRDLVGQRVEATVTRNRWAAAGGRATLDLWFTEGRRLDPFVAALAEPRPEAEPMAAELPALRALSA